MKPQWFESYVAYTLSKYGMSECVLGMAEEFKPYHIAVNALWPKTIIATAAIKNLLGGEEMMKHARKPEIVAESAYLILRWLSYHRAGKSTYSEVCDEKVSYC